MTVKQKQVIVVGGGMVGAACAAGLGQLGLDTLIIEQQKLPDFSPHLPYDLRISAISAASVQQLRDLQAWEAIEQSRACPYRCLETWETEGISVAFHSRDLGLPELGFMVENNVVQRALWQAFNSHVQTAINAIRHIEKCGQNWHIFLDNGECFAAPLLIAADGANSKLRQFAGIGTSGWQYRQSCLLISVETELPQQDCTWQQFFPSGPRAFLPLLGNQACLVWYDSPEKIAQLKQLSKEKLAQAIQQAFPPRLGKIRVLDVGDFALTRRHANTYVKEGIVLVGDAAHTINPLAGQGVNLGFKDVKALLNVIEQAQKCGQNFADFSVLNRYQRQRKADNLLMQSAMDLFYKAFKEDILPLKLARNAALFAAERLTPLKKRALKYALGL